ncbi:unnamed protein product [Spirodela intermedia]|uniref:DYW domain-containing protein n=1 Tax=Spirodela intermedia TaxID=51605 RepID=A0A7I8J9W0_SPIIN|nr:unnamed protein product [Spirodela intermedia]CAA6666937.1 unnamed protein product [Spirodela intermedia]
MLARHWRPPFRRWSLRLGGAAGAAVPSSNWAISRLVRERGCGFRPEAVRRNAGEESRLLEPDAGCVLQEARPPGGGPGALRRNPSPDVVSFNTMLSCHFRNGDAEGARRLFNQMPARDCVSWNAMISGLAENGATEEKNLVSWNTMIAGLVRAGDLALAEKYFREAPDKDDVVLQTVMITGYMAAGEVDRARSLFDGMPARNPVTWNAMISGFVDNQQPENALKIFQAALGGGSSPRLRPNSSTLSSALLGCSHLSALDLGKQIHQLACKLPLILDPVVGTSLVSMYCKCGDLGAARKLFEEMPRRDVALKLFHEMTNNQGILPNWVTFVAALSACAHVGMVGAGRRIFRSMRERYGVEPRPDHYFPMVDLLCRAGLLAEAAELIRRSPFPPHGALFGALLGACRAQKNPELAEFAAGRLLELNPRSAGAYVQLANVYAAAGRWEDVSRVRRLMRDGNSDRSHRELEAIWAKLAELEEAMKRAGHAPHLGSAGHDVVVEEKERMLLGHSEKLAIAFGLLAVPAWATIRVFKNLRVCVDCHNATKLISTLEGREIVVRDTSRFHHFRMVPVPVGLLVRRERKMQPCSTTTTQERLEISFRARLA